MWRCAGRTLPAGEHVGVCFIIKFVSLRTSSAIQNYSPHNYWCHLYLHCMGYCYYIQNSQCLVVEVPVLNQHFHTRLCVPQPITAIGSHVTGLVIHCFVSIQWWTSGLPRCASMRELQFIFDSFHSIPCPNSRQPSVVASVQANCVQFHPLDSSHLYIGADTVSIVCVIIIITDRCHSIPPPSCFPCPTPPLPSPPPPMPLLLLPPSSPHSPPAPPPPSCFLYILDNYYLWSGCGLHALIEPSEDHVCHHDSCIMCRHSSILPPPPGQSSSSHEVWTEAHPTSLPVPTTRGGVCL